MYCHDILFMHPLEVLFRCLFPSLFRNSSGLAMEKIHHNIIFENHILSVGHLPDDKLYPGVRIYKDSLTTSHNWFR